VKRKHFGGSKQPFQTLHVHVMSDTMISTDVVMEDTPLISFGENGNDLTLFFVGEALDRTIEALLDLRSSTRRAPVSASKKFWPDHGFRLEPDTK